jgi:hypothetical protein
MPNADPLIREAGSVVDIGALDNPDGRRHLVVVATTAGKAVGVEGHDDLPVTFAAGTLVDVADFYDHVRQRHVVVAGLTDGTVHQAYWKATTVGIEELWAVPDV